MNRIFTLLTILCILFFTQISAQQDFTRVFSLPTETWEVGGFGGLVAGVDFDGDGKLEIYACNTNMVDRPEELIPRLYKFEWNGTDWEMVWMTETDIPQQNTWPGLTWGDLDKDGKYEIIWAPANFLDAQINPNPPRILIYEYPGDGSDNMGYDFFGGFIPNAYTTIVDKNNTEVRPFRIVIEDIDSDGDDEIIFADRRAGTGDYHFGVISVSDVPDDADGTEDWFIEENGIDFTVLDGTNNKWDIAVIDNYIYLWNATTARQIFPIKYDSGVWEALPPQSGIGDNSFKSAQVVDLDNDGTKEILVGNWYTTTSGGAKIHLLKQVDDTLQIFEIADLSDLGGIWLVGGASGDLDGDGYLDFVFGAEYYEFATTQNLLFRISYKGGDITDPNNYVATAIDSLLRIEGGDLDVIAVANLDGDPEDEVVYTQGFTWPGYEAADLVILDITWTPPTNVERESSNIPSNFYVEQNYPNPFNPSTVIKFGITEATTVDLRIYDVLGKEVAVLVNNQYLEAGSYNATFNAEGLASGIYVYRITAGNNTTSMKMQLLK